jgi:glucokinase
MLLVGDIGGTKTDLAIFSTAGGLDIESQATFRSANYPSLEAIVQEFLAGKETPITRAVFGVAGPVVNGRSKVTNLPWHLVEETMQQTLNIPVVRLLNDLEAIAYAVPHLPVTELETINGDPASPPPAGHKGIIAPGTGLGEAILFYHDQNYHVIASEGGHAAFGPTDALQLELLRYLLGKFNHVSYERVCSGGLGIPNVYAYLKESRHAEESPTVTTALQATHDPTPVIIGAALNNECELCIATLRVFISILGTEASNLALKIMSGGGIYLGGGLPPRIVSKLKDGPFMAAFLNKGRFSELLSHIPVYVIMTKQPGLWGSAHYGLQL